MFPEPVIKNYQGIDVVRDDLIPGGTKARYLADKFQTHDVIVYATPAYGGAQVALAKTAQRLGKRAVLFVAKRKTPHPMTKMALDAGAHVYQVPHGYLAHVQSKARKYCEDTGAYYLPFGADTQDAITTIAQAASAIPDWYDEIWCSAGSGVLTRGLQKRFVKAAHHAVQVGRDPDAGRARVWKHPLKYEQSLKLKTPFPSNGNYDRKAWQFCTRFSKGRVLFWNVLG